MCQASAPGFAQAIGNAFSATTGAEHPMTQYAESHPGLAMFRSSKKTPRTALGGEPTPSPSPDRTPAQKAALGA